MRAGERNAESMHRTEAGGIMADIDMNKVKVAIGRTRDKKDAISKDLKKKKQKQKRKHAKAIKHKETHHKDKRVAIFRYAYYEPLFKFFVEQVLDCDYLALPPATKKTASLGIQNSTEEVCAPFKHMMGDWIEALERGADILVQVGGPCRLGYYGEMQETILRDMGYDFTMLNFSHGIELGYVGWAKEVLRQVNPDIDITYGVKRLLACGKMLKILDQARDTYMANAGFEIEGGSYKRAWENLLDALCAASNAREIDEAYLDYCSSIREIEIDKPANPIRIGIVGELYTAIDGDSNLYLDEKLIDMGVEIHRTLNFSNRYLSYNEPNLRRGISEYVKFDMGPTSTMTISAAKRYAELSYDGIIHAKCAGCTPEIDTISVLRRVSEDYRIPILYLTYDTETSDTGLMTRLEAFYDMLAMKKRAKAV